MNKKGQKGITIGIIVFAFIAIVVLSLLGGAFYNVSEGDVGVMFKKFGADKGFVVTEFPQGFGFKMPYRDKMITIPFRTQSINFHASEKEAFGAIQPKDINGINFFVDMTVRYRLDPTQASEFIEQKGEGIAAIENILSAAARADSTRGVFGKYAQEDVPNNRTKIAREIKEVLQQRLDDEASGKLTDGFIIIEAIDMRDVQFNQKIEDAIIAKQTKKQDAEKQEYNLQIALKEKEIAIVGAEKTKAAKILIAEGEAQAIREVAFAKADGIEAVNTAYQNMPMEYVMVKAYESIKSNDKLIIGLDQIIKEGNSIGFLDQTKLISSLYGKNETI